MPDEQQPLMSVAHLGEFDTPIREQRASVGRTRIADGERVRTTCDIETQPEGFPLMIVAPRGTAGVVAGYVAKSAYPYTIHMPTTAVGKPAGYTEDVYVAASEVEPLNPGARRVPVEVDRGE